MSVSKIYVYFNEGGQLISKTPYIDTGSVRQGSDFELNILFNENTELIKKGDMISVAFKCPGEADYNLFPFLSYYDRFEQELEQNNLKFYNSGIVEFDKDLSKYGIYAGKKYLCWTFNSVDAYHKSLPVLTERDGNLEVQLTVFEEGSLTTPTTKLGTFRIFIEKTMNYDSPFDVSSEDLERFIKEVKEISKMRGFGIHGFYINEETGNLIVMAERSDDLVEGNYSINKDGCLDITI